MKGKAALLFLYGFTVVIVLRKWYGQNNTGLPIPSAFVGPTYAYAILLLLNEFIEGIPIMLGIGGAFFFWQNSLAATTAPTKKPAGKVPTVPPTKIA